MKIKLLIILGVILIGKQLALAYYLPDQLYDSFGFYLDTTAFPEEEAVMLQKAAALDSAETQEFACFPSVRGRGYFGDLPCVTFYHLWPCVEQVHSEIPQSLILYNHCSGAIYHFRGGIESFNAVFADYLKVNYDPDFIIPLIYLYFLTQRLDGFKRILFQPQDFCGLYDTIYVDQTEEEDPELWARLQTERETIPKALKPLKIEKRDKYWRIDFYAYTGDINRIEHWIVDAYPDSLKMESKETVYKNLGDRFRNPTKRDDNIE